MPRSGSAGDKLSPPRKMELDAAPRHAFDGVRIFTHYAWMSRTPVPSPPAFPTGKHRGLRWSSLYSILYSVLLK